MALRLVTLGAVAVCVASAPLAEAGQLDPKQARTLSKIVRKVDQIEKAVKSLETSKTRGTPAFSDAVARKSKQQERRFSGAKEGLATLPECDEVNAQRKRLEDLRARLGVVVAEASGQAGDRAAKSGAWRAHVQTPAYEADKAVLWGLKAYEAYRFQLDDRSFRSLTREDFQETIALLDALPQVEARLAALEARYRAFGREGQSVLDALAGERKRLAACEAAMAKARQAGPQTLAELGRTLDAETAKVLALRDQARAQKRPFPLAYSLMDRTSKCRQLEEQIRRSLGYLIRLRPGALRELQAAADAALAKYRETVRATRSEILASQRAPRDDYRGPDAAKLKAFVAEAATGRTHGQAVLSVHLTGAWQEIDKHVWDRTTQSWVRVHKSSLSGHLLVSHDATYVFKRRIEVERDHLRGDALQLFGDFQRYPEPRPDQLIPRANLSN